MKQAVPWRRSLTTESAKSIVGVVALVLCLAAKAPGPAAPGGLQVKGQWMRFLLPSLPAAGYFTLINGTSTTRTLVGASSPACGSLMLHQTLHEHGEERMRMVARVRVGPHGRVSFEPGGYHLMCKAPASTMKPGATVSVTLRFADGQSLTANFPVRGARGK